MPFDQYVPLIVSSQSSFIKTALKKAVSFYFHCFDGYEFDIFVAVAIVVNWWIRS